MIIIMSSAYVSDEFQAEIGKIPPTLLPLGNKKLVEHQIESLKRSYPDEKIILSLPESFILSATLAKQFSILEIDIRCVPDRFTLSEAVLYILNTSDVMFNLSETIKILYGDTYISDFSFSCQSQNLIAIAEAKTSYSWEYVSELEDKNLVWCGFFKFGNISSLLKSLALKRENFNEAIKLYAKFNQVDTVQTYHWNDLGHINTYFLARAQLTTQRAFNELNISDGIVRKNGEPQIKIEAEANWFTHVPASIKRFTPLLIDSGIKDGRFGYELEYLSSMPLNELFVHGNNNAKDWDVIFAEIVKFFEASQIHSTSVENNAIEQEFTALIRDKTFQRLNGYAKDNNISLNTPLFYDGMQLPSALSICSECIDLVRKLPNKAGVLHGDLCFSNMLFDSRGVRLKLIDPRGLDSYSNLTIYGDAKYDLAKLTHSVIGLYDFIISGNYKILNEGTKENHLEFDIEERVRDIQNKFWGLEYLKGITIEKIMPLVVLLFFSMLPLHTDRPDRQDAMWLNALRLYKISVMEKDV